MLLKLLALARCAAKQRATGHHQVFARGVVTLGNQEELLLSANCYSNALAVVFAQHVQHAARLFFNSMHRTQKRRLLVKRLARVAAKRRGDAQNLILDERVRCRIPSRVATRFERGAQTARGEARRIGLALNQLFS